MGRKRSGRGRRYIVMFGAMAILAFHQAYQPIGDSIVLSAIIAGIPLYILVVMLAVLRLPAWLSAVTAMLSAAVVALLGWHMPAHLTLSATTEGMAFGLWPISWIVLNAVFFHNLTIASGDFDVIRRSLTRLTEDRRVQALIVAFCFGALMEGIAGFGAPVAISAAIMASLGFEPIIAALVSMATIALLLRVCRPGEIWRFEHERPDLRGRAAAVPRGVGAAVAQLVDPPGRVARAYLMYVVLVVVILIGQMGNLPFFSGSPPNNPKNALHPPANVTADFKCGAPAFKLCTVPWIGPTIAQDAQAFKFPYWSFQWPGSYTTVKGKPSPQIFREPPIVGKSTAYPLTFNWDFLAAAGSLVLYASIVAFLIMAARGARLGVFFRTYGRTLRQLALPIVTIAFILGIAQIMNYSGMTSTLALFMAKAGFFFPFASAFIGWLGVFLTGSDTSSNTLFGPMQALTAKQILVSGGHLSPVLT